MIKRLLSATAFACLLLAAPASASVTCSYEQMEPAGSAGNYLEIRADEIEDQAAIVRRGQLIVVKDDRTGIPTACTNRAPTTINVDRIVFIAAADGAGLFVSLAGGPFEPGASPIDPTSEIKIQARSLVRFPGNIGVGGTRGGNDFSVHTHRRTGRHQVNLDHEDDRMRDLVFPRSVVGLLIRSGRGSDFIYASDLRSRLSLSVYAGPGGDGILGGPGADILFGGAGADFIRGRGGADEIDCGAGRTDLARIEKRDRVVRCENRRAERPLAFP